MSSHVDDGKVVKIGRDTHNGRNTNAKSGGPNPRDTLSARIYAGTIFVANVQVAVLRRIRTNAFHALDDRRADATDDTSQTLDLRDPRIHTRPGMESLMAIVHRMELAKDGRGPLTDNPRFVPANLHRLSPRPVVNMYAAATVFEIRPRPYVLRKKALEVVLRTTLGLEDLRFVFQILPIQNSVKSRAIGSYLDKRNRGLCPEKHRRMIDDWIDTDAALRVELRRLSSTVRKT